ncbi:prephenate dehydrogenase [Brachyspira aalborgi]|jgi:prephenate dehydrogenase|uniref:Prephenate dehydrogenase n=1 Tax=Brachyspira aalborgi TaxID=29522 RepID=A0ABY3K913_9SPIR|nr:prephenate dehydrogenase [Brachyspira aalborgi]MBS4764434.1 prephenate dehydrogenase [Brachyspira sp.]TXJ32376.1 prephenate dehydrogenase [Brachyspira aalborgi]TXJ40229.1 prephenate dehydrogenase [Brachyspira aalborgi]CCY74239.1 prephenate dehydrogenase [Brachyspira sp. CAG:700]
MLKITVIGLGLMGGSLVKALKKSKKNYRIWAIDTNKKNIKSALKDKYIEKGFYNYSNIKEAFEFADIIMICSIPSIALNIIKKYKNLIDDKKILSDFCGVKKDIFKATSNKKYIGLHPMAGKEKGGYDNSTESLFKNSNAIIVVNDKAKKEDIKKIEKLSKDIGCKKIIFSNAEKHDYMIAFTSQLMHIIACSIVNHKQFLESLGYEGNSLGDHTRVGTIDADMWSELFLYNSKYLSKSLSQYINCLRDFKRALNNKNIKELKKLMINSNKIKSERLR